MPKSVNPPSRPVQIPRKPEGLPAWESDADRLDEAGAPSLLLYAIAGPRNPAQTNPLAAIADGIAGDLRMLAEIDDPHGCLMRLTHRTEALALLLTQA
jgi:hypothetical protein